MPSALPFLLLLLTLSLSLSTTTSAIIPPPHQSHLIKHKSHIKDTNESTSYQEYIQLTRPLPFTTLTPSCTLQAFSGDFANTINLPPSTVFYSPPENCTWSAAVLHLSAAANGSQYDRIAAVWLAGAELLRTSTAEPTDDGVFWNVQKDVTKYSSLLRQDNLNLSVMLENIVNDVYTAVYQVNITFLYYDVGGDSTNTTAPFSLTRSSKIRKLKESPGFLKMNHERLSSMDLYDKPADLIVPISDIGDEGFWFRIEKESGVKYTGIKIPLNTYKVVIEVYVSFHGNDEFWYSNPPDSYIDANNLTTARGHGAYREVPVTIDDNVVGSVIPFPVIFTGGINPLFWEPVVSIGAFDLPSYDIDLTPFLGMLLDGKEHSFGLGVADSISFWLVDANLHLWLDGNVDQVQAKPIEYNFPKSCIERESKFWELDGKFEIEAKQKTEFSGWVNSSMGNWTTYVHSKVKFKSSIKFDKGGSEKVVEQKVKVENEIRVKSDVGSMISRLIIKREYPLKVTTSSLAGSQEGTYMMITKLEHSLKEEKSSENLSSTLVNSQEASGWVLVKDHDVLAGGATTDQRYTFKDNISCYSRAVSAANGKLMNDTSNFLCAPSSSSI